MGLCKCIQKKVTNQFCFEHRVNVCEHCMVEEHPQCIIQSYLRWLNDSDYNPVCQLCQDHLVSSECIRLVCYDVFHKSCLNDWASKLPTNTAPAGYRCPICSSAIFPSPNLVSPVADALRKFLTAHEWATAGLGIPIVKNYQEVDNVPASESDFIPSIHSESFNNADRGIPDGRDTHMNSPSVSEPFISDCLYGSPQHRHLSLNKQRKDSDSSSTVLIPDKDVDHPAFDKYKRRPLFEWLNQLMRTFRRPAPRHHQGLIGITKSSLFVILIFIFVVLVFLLSYFGRRSDYIEDDPMFDPLNNPNVRVQE